MEQNKSNSVFLDALAQRRSVRATMFQSPGPTKDELAQILTIAIRTPDHKKLAPWRFIVFEEDARRRAGVVFANALKAEEPESASPVRLQAEQDRFLRAPCVVALVASFVEKIGVPEWEQTLSTGAVGMNLVHGANALGYATCWLTEWMAYNSEVASAFGLASNERIAGFIYIGTPTQTQDDRQRPEVAAKVTRF